MQYCHFVIFKQFENKYLADYGLTSLVNLVPQFILKQPLESKSGLFNSLVLALILYDMLQ